MIIGKIIIIYFILYKTKLRIYTQKRVDWRSFISPIYKLQDIVPKLRVEKQTKTEMECAIIAVLLITLFLVSLHKERYYNKLK